MSEVIKKSIALSAFAMLLNDTEELNPNQETKQTAPKTAKDFF